MATVTIDASNPSASVNISVLLSLVDKILTLADNNTLVLGDDEYILLNDLRFAVTTGLPSTNTISQIVITYS